MRDEDERGRVGFGKRGKGYMNKLKHLRVRSDGNHLAFDRHEKPRPFSLLCSIWKFDKKKVSADKRRHRLILRPSVPSCIARPRPHAQTSAILTR